MTRISTEGPRNHGLDPNIHRDERILGAIVDSLRLLCGVYWGPTEEVCGQTLETSFLQPFDKIATEFKASWTADLRDLQNFLDGFSDPASLFAYLEQGYVRLFVSDRGGITAPLYASCYEDEENSHLMGHAAVQMRKTLSDLGISISDDVGEPPDHLAIELEVLYYLLTQVRGSDGRINIARAADFAADSMIPWVNAFYLRLTGEVHCRFYPLMTAVLLGVLHVVADMNSR